MARIYRRSDRIKIKIDDLTVTMAPLSMDQKAEAQTAMGRGHINSDIGLITKGISLALKYGLKEIEGLELADGTPYKLEFEGDALTDSCIDDMFNLEMHAKLVLVCSSLINSIPKQFTDKQGNPIEGVEIVSPTKKEVADPN